MYPMYKTCKSVSYLCELHDAALGGEECGCCCRGGRLRLSRSLGLLHCDWLLLLQDDLSCLGVVHGPLYGRHNGRLRLWRGLLGLQVLGRSTRRSHIGLRHCYLLYKSACLITRVCIRPQLQGYICTLWTRCLLYRQ